VLVLMREGDKVGVAQHRDILIELAREAGSKRRLEIVNLPFG
jgi:hypothetical protein